MMSHPAGEDWEGCLVQHEIPRISPGPNWKRLCKAEVIQNQSHRRENLRQYVPKNLKTPPICLKTKEAEKLLCCFRKGLISPSRPLTTGWYFLDVAHFYNVYIVIRFFNHKGSSASCVNSLRIQLLPSKCKARKNEWNSIRIRLLQNINSKYSNNTLYYSYWTRAYCHAVGT